MDGTTPRSSKYRGIITMCLMVFLPICLCVGFTVWVFATLPTYEESAIAAAEGFIQSMIANPEQFIADDADSFAPPWQRIWECYATLQAALQRHDQQYTLVLDRVYGYYGTPVPSPIGNTESEVFVTFSDGTLIELYFYNLRLEGCRDLTDQ